MIRRYLLRAPASVVTLYALVAAFGAYFCMYAFRKPFTAASFEDKAILVIAQLIGYTLAKGVGIIWIPQVKKTVPCSLRHRIDSNRRIGFDPVRFSPATHPLDKSAHQWFSSGFYLGSGFQLPGGQTVYGSIVSRPHH